ncbi:bsu-protein phosphatase [Tritrichomonas foetus]|uniref:Bsu-protein phosphatase n=1 Tax=Tritrichomonas foetus TaxID=1144522 RepID=A0A1J4J0K0_9EUKA|nr:bsu-protein phosphatase [Tritrichomonas foetus]|eukprot:OHS92930.1 bsu-protein phosphatase [Tritrichomonas foetus]
MKNGYIDAFVFLNNFYLTHSETNMMNAMYGFEMECTKKYSKSMFEAFSDFFNTMPLGHVINSKVLIVHGGLFSDQTVTIDSLQTMNRIGQPPESGPLNDILWSDPMEQNGFAPSPRGVTRTFGPDITEAFLERNNLELLIRSHQVQENGYIEMHNGKCITVFSAPNYIGQMGNKGAVVKLTFADDLSLTGKEFEQFVAQPIPTDYPPMKYASLGRFF